MPTSGFDFRRLAVVALAVTALGLGVAACGGGDDSETPAPATTTTETTETVALTTEDLISQGDAICAEVNAALGAIASSTADDTTKQSQVSDIYDGLAARLGDLGTPTDGDPPTDVIAAAQDLADGSTDSAEFQTAASEYGFTDCSEAPGTVVYPDSTGTDSSIDTDSTDTYVPPTTTEPVPVEPPVTTPPPTTGGGVAPTTPDTGGSTGGSSGGTSSGGIGPG